MAERTIEPTRGPGERAAGHGDPKGVGLAIGGALVALFAILPAVSIVVLYTFLTIYALVRAIGPGKGEDAVAIVVGFVLIGSVLTLLIASAVYLIGRAITPRRRTKA